jgi:hydroxymethylpyrimidine kinase / phosphomethylpyrimidine kinase / thiamine-phosphate diphosphorylase
VKQKLPVIYCVGGSDSSAHAGLQADLRTGLDLGCHVQTIVSCVTAQNSKKLGSVEAVSKEMFDQQWHILFEDVLPDAIKVSLLPNTELVLQCVEWLKKIKEKLQNVTVIFDPVMAASNKDGNRLQQSDAGMLLSKLLPYIDIITPNSIEFEALTGIPAQQDINAIKQSLNSRFENSSCAWLIKGGHSKDSGCIDWFITQNQVTGFSSARLETPNNRGTGCTLATALACFIAQGYQLLDALTLAKSYITGALKSGVQIGQGAGPLGSPGWPLQFENIPRIISTTDNHADLTKGFASIPADDLGLYPLVESVEWLEQVLKNGVKTVQLRIKNPDNSIRRQIEQAVTLGQRYSARVFINDHWQLAIESAAYGVHLGQEDLDSADLSAIQSSGLALGVSTHGYFEIARAVAIRPSYIAIGHIFPTQTKNMPLQAQGLKRLSRYVQLLKGYFPTVAIGGISSERAESVLSTGVDSIALVSAITKASDPEASIRRLQTLFTNHHSELRS